MAKGVARGRNLVSGSFGATIKSGFNVPHGDPISKAPKFSDQFFVTFESSIDTGKELWEHYSGKVKTVSNVDINTTFITLDQYGKRVHIPTRVDFGPITIVLYDTVDGKTYELAKKIYENNFVNNTINTENGALDSAIKDVNSGAKYTGRQQVHYFSRITVYDFFGDLYGSNGQLNKIEIINPLVSNISISERDYSNTDIRTITITLQPENIIIKPTVGSIATPRWLDDGLDYIDKKTAESSAKFFDDPRGTKEFLSNLESTVNYAVGGDVAKFDLSDSVSYSSGGDVAKFDLSDSVSYSSDNEKVNNAINNAQLALLEKLAKLQVKIDTASTPDERQAAIDELIEARQKATPIDASNTGAIDFTNALIADQQVGIKIPNDIPDYTSAVTQTIGSGSFNFDSSLSTALKSELINSFFNGTKFDLGRVGMKVAAGAIGNTGVGNLQTLGRTSTSRFGIAGDIIRDSIKSATAPKPVTGNSRTVDGRGNEVVTAKDQKQNNISSLTKNLRRR